MLRLYSGHQGLKTNRTSIITRKMSTMAKCTLAGSVAITTGIIYYVHYSQRRDRDRMKEGVLVDMARQERKRQNIHQLELQSDLTKILKRKQEEQDRSDKLQAQQAKEVQGLPKTL